MKKINKRIQSAITQGFIFNTIIIVVLLGVIIAYIVPNIVMIEEEKKALNTKVEAYKRIQKEGITLKEFKNIYGQKKEKKDAYIVNLLRNIDKELYENNLKNTTNKSYSEFLLERKEYIFEKKENENFRKMEKKINTILPSYTDTSRTEGTLSDYKFTNFIETLLFTFNLETQDSIGVGTISTISEEDTNLLTSKSSIFYIPLHLKLIGKKADILDFIHYIENVGSISIEKKELIVYSDNSIKKVIEGEKYFRGYNIYENQITDIESITMPQYIDTSAEPTNGESLINFVKKSQGRDKFTIEINMRFYVSGIPDYKVEKFISEVIKTHSTLKKDIQSTSAKIKKRNQKATSSDVLFSISTIDSLLHIVISMEEEVKSLKNEFFKNKSKIEEVYKKSYEIDNKLSKIQKALNESKNIIEIN